ncbi:1-aminocyclopropane-1-carboxylate oxidase homolog 1-like [Typha angustifolia]|uniref:1-aminocyclopropane-1-carboxylate oxidase homolog 1-like n=1 Tax=Typha angustifolia TaxID=59011 RepID=UPI003C2E41CF
MTSTTVSYDRATELKAFDETKAGVKGLVDAGITKIPPLFVHAPETTTTTTSKPPMHASIQIPIINLEGRRADVIEEVRSAAETFGLFHVTNHGIPLMVMEEMIAGVRRFHEEDLDVKKKYYTRDLSRKVGFNTNSDLYRSKAADWRDTLRCVMAPEEPKPEEMPLAIREIIFEYANYIKKLAIVLLELLSEALGLNRDHLNKMDFNKGLELFGHYYPPCPDPGLTLGTSRHSDPNFLTILLEDHIGGLQVLHQHHWIDVPPLAGALLVNIGDLLQLISNDRFESVEHRVIAKSIGPRISVACFFRTYDKKEYGPIKELISSGSPPLYKAVTVRDYVKLFVTLREQDRKSALGFFKL